MFFSEREISDLFKAWLAISFAFAVVLGGGSTNRLLFNLVFASVTVGVAFIAHELAHKFMAQRFGCWAEFRSFNLGLMLAVLMSFTGFIFAAPGAVMIGGMVTKSQNGKIAAAGPLTNIIIALIFLALRPFVPAITPSFTLLPLLISYGLSINAWLALFNLIPFWQLDGNKVLAWRTDVWLGLTIVAGLLVFVL